MQGISRIALMAALAATSNILVASHAGAQQATTSTDFGEVLGTISLTASSEPVEIGRTGATVDVVTEEDIRKAGDISAATLLARLPGVSMTRNGGLGASSALRLRGLSGPYIGVRIDGIDVADPSGTQCAYDFGTTTMGGISRIEVLRGSQSALYGSEAIGGVVDITTWRPTRQGTQAEVAIEGGSDSTYSGTVSAGLLTDRAELAFTLSRTKTDGISAYAFGTEDDAFRATNLSFSAAYDLTETMRIGLNGFGRDSYTEYDTQFSDADNVENGKLRGARIFLQAETGAVQHHLSYAHTKTQRIYNEAFSDSSYDGKRDQLRYTGNWQASEQLSLNWGLDWTKEKFDSVYASSFGTTLEGGDVWTRAVHTELLYAPTQDLDLSLAVRRDDHENFGGKTTGRAALAWRPTNDWVIRAVASTGFRAPSLYEMYNGFGGNPDLQPETSRSFELGAEYLLPGGSVQATLFDTTIKDKIDWQGAGYIQIPGDTRTRGIELTGKYQIAPDWELFGIYTYTDAMTRNAGGETRLARVPRHDLNLGLEGQITDRIATVVSVKRVIDFYDDYFSGGTVRTKMPDYTLVNVSVSYAINETTQAHLRVENLFDKDYQTSYNYGQPGRSVYVGLRSSF
ncbi:TonB-dependent receptor plug domain-containing protein [Szabonella alba]|uniref:TonB-dependent receptor n=1 Tax=Szabonella alba TaxID=2804194 RepID=A0A8K0VE13_9RHOB|nr:TonB-dependent receptor [Szabonella alba]MBL4918493.1 TonB-dependent receptor [Szabonella alba]